MKAGKIVFLSGPMRGVEDYVERFYGAAADLERAHPDWAALNPAWLPEHLPDRVGLDLAMDMLQRADAIYMLPGWEDSLGAVCERDYALRKGLEVIYG